MKTIVQGLKEVKELLSDKRRWIKKQSAKDKDGNSAVANSDNAVCWCLTGAINRVAGGGKTQLYQDICNSIKKQLGESHAVSIDTAIIEYNDNPNIKHYHVMNMLQKVIDRETIWMN